VLDRDLVTVFISPRTLRRCRVRGTPTCQYRLSIWRIADEEGERRPQDVGEGSSSSPSDRLRSRSRSGKAFPIGSRVGFK
jgi:hypothetical protein